jgi:hypothetical protein
MKGKKVVEQVTITYQVTVILDKEELIYNDTEGIGNDIQNLLTEVCVDDGGDWRANSISVTEVAK